MAQIRARLLVGILKLVVKRQMMGTPDVRRIRKAFDVALFGAPHGISVTPASVGGVKGEWLQGRSPGPVTLLYVHGGAFVACSPRTHRAATGGLAKRGFRVFAVEYRLAPEHRYPAGLDDVAAAYRGLIETGVSPGQLVLAGESAGGNLVLSLLHRLREAGLPLPAAVAAWSPVTDLTGQSRSFETNADKDAMLDGRRIGHMSDLYLPSGTDVRTPQISPVFGDYAGMPPILVHVGADEVLRDDGIRVAEKARQDGAETVLKVWPVVPHAWQLFPILPEAGRSIDETASFLLRHAAGG